MVELGGSSVNNLADSLLAFGQVPGSSNLVATTYTVFGNLVKSQYPEFVPSIDPATNVIDASYLDGVSKKMTGQQKALIARARPVFKAAPKGSAPHKVGEPSPVEYPVQSGQGDVHARRQSRTEPVGARPSDRRRHDPWKFTATPTIRAARRPRCRYRKRARLRWRII